MQEVGIAHQWEGETMVILVSPDSRGRLALGRVVQDKQYAVEVDGDGVITLTPSVVLSERELDELNPVRPVLSPEEVFGVVGISDAADALSANKEWRRRGNPVRRIMTEDSLHSLIWGDAA